LHGDENNKQERIAPTGRSEQICVAQRDFATKTGTARNASKMAARELETLGKQRLMSPWRARPALCEFEPFTPQLYTDLAAPARTLYWLLEGARLG
jgi:hypothetical protein